LNWLLKKEFFLDGYLRTGDVSPPFDRSTILADSVTIILKNGKKWTNYCIFDKTPKYSECEKTRNLFSKKSYRIIDDKKLQWVSETPFIYSITKT
jgi:hypothetical protein